MVTIADGVAGRVGEVSAGNCSTEMFEVLVCHMISKKSPGSMSLK